MNLYIYPYKTASASVKSLKEALGVKSIKKEGSKFVGSVNKTVLNWGCHTLPDEVMACNVINKPEAVKIASNKLEFFNLAYEEGLNIPDFTTSQDDARIWSESGAVVVARTKLNGHSGDGMIVLESLAHFEEIYHGDVAMYVRYIPKREEYRAHVFNGEVIDIQRKAVRKNSKLKPNFRIRSHNNGFVFVRNGFEAPPQVFEQALKTISITGLDFGAVDIIWNEYRSKAFVLEVNTAPGLEGTTLINYSKSMLKYYGLGKDADLMSKNLENFVAAGVSDGESSGKDSEVGDGLGMRPVSYTIKDLLEESDMPQPVPTQTEEGPAWIADLQ